MAINDELKKYGLDIYKTAEGTYGIHEKGSQMGAAAGTRGLKGFDPVKYGLTPSLTLTGKETQESLANMGYGSFSTSKGDIDLDTLLSQYQSRETANSPDMPVYGPGQFAPGAQPVAPKPIDTTNQMNIGTPEKPMYIPKGSPADLSRQGLPVTPESAQGVGATIPTAQGGVPASPNALADIQASPIPPLPQGYGEGSGMDKATWAVKHRENIFNAYQKYGITPSADEVNWQLTHNPDINSIEASIAQAVQSGADTRGKPTAPSTTAPTAPTGVAGGTPAVPNQLEEEYKKNLVPSADEVATQNQLNNIIAGKELGLTSVAEQPIAMSFITGQQSAIERRAAIQTIPLAQKLALEQAKRVAALDASKFALERQDIRDKTAREMVQKEADRITKLEEKKLEIQAELEKETRSIKANQNKVLSVSEAKALGVPYGTTVGQASQMRITPRYVGGGGGGGKTTPEESELPAGWENNGDFLRQSVTDDISNGATREQITAIYQEKGANMELVNQLLDELLPQEKGAGLWETISGFGDWLDAYKDKVRESKGWSTKNKPARKIGGW